MDHGIQMRQLRAFATLAEELHFGRAAERLGIGQALLSQQIRRLEERLGARLFERTTRHVRITAAGETFLAHARELLDGLDRAVSHTRALSGERTGRLVVAGVHIALSHVLPPVIAAFRQDWPAVTVDVRPLSTADQLRTLEEGDINIAFIRPTERLRFMQSERLLSEGFVAVLPRMHPLAARPELRLADFAGQPLIGYASVLGAGYSTVVINALRRAGVHPRVVQECSHTLAVATLVGAGVGLAIAPAWVGQIASPHLVFHPLPELPRAIDLTVAWPAGETSPAVLGFIETARRVAPALTAGDFP